MGIWRISLIGSWGSSSSILKVVIYSATIAAMMFFAFLESKLKRELTDSAIQPTKFVSDIGILNSLAERMKRERVLKGMPKQALFKFRMVVALKVLFFVILIAEVLLLQRPN